MRAVTALLALLLTTTAGLAHADEPTVRTHHIWRAGAAPQAYEAEAGRLDLPAADGRTVRARMFFVAYRPSGGAASRPVMFVWNGGPGAPTTTLHYRSIGPVRVEDGRVVDNADSVLAVTDLVFVDAVGTGFSRVTDPRFEPEFYNTLGDVEAFATFVRLWRVKFGRTMSRVVLLGESFGAPRAAGVAARLLASGDRVDAVALVSGGLGLGRAALPPALDAALRLPEWAVIAGVHGKGLVAAGRPAAEVFAEVRAWATDVYTPALTRLPALPDDERTAIAERLARYTGLPPAAIDRTSLVVTPRQFRTELLRDRGLSLPIFDLRRTSPVRDSADDERAMERHLRTALRYSPAIAYVGFESAPAADAGPSVNERWDYFAPGTAEAERQAAIADAVRVGGGPPGVSEPWIRQALEANPRLRVLVATGRYDAGQCLQIAETVRRQEPAVAGAYTAACYEGGHMMYLDAPARAAFAADVVSLVRGPGR